ncbi:MAG TPA: GDP-mannose 4,6-dehydratase [Gemmatimonadaceae bacterium]|nr:GDP-mannose 4,6-dehydratase [Gemmatimonadaceae bacterium]
MRALVTGAGGFVGQWLCRELLQAGWTVWGTTLDGEVPPGALDAEARGAVRWLRCDVTCESDLRGALDAAQPDTIAHLAAISFAPAAAADPFDTLQVNVLAAAKLLGLASERLAAGTLDPRVLVVGSGEQYGRHDAKEQPLREGAEQNPASVYGASKALQEELALKEQKATGLRVIAVRPFNHSGAWQSDRFLIPALVHRALSLKGTPDAEMAVGNMSAVRDFLHVTDVCRAYLAVLDRGVPGEVYNVASGKGVSVSAVAERVLALTGTRARFRIDPALVRPVEVPELVGDPSKLRSATGWSPERSFDDILHDVIRAATR